MRQVMIVIRRMLRFYFDGVVVQLGRVLGAQDGGATLGATDGDMSAYAFLVVDLATSFATL